MPFQKGQSGNPGGKPGEARQALNALLDERFPITKRRKVIDKLVEDAMSDDWDVRSASRTLLLAYTYGKPVERQEVSGPDGAPIDITSAAQDEAAKELELWRKQMREQLNTSNVAPTPPISSITTES